MMKTTVRSWRDAQTTWTLAWRSPRALRQIHRGEARERERRARLTQATRERKTRAGWSRCVEEGSRRQAASQWGAGLAAQEGGLTRDAVALAGRRGEKAGQGAGLWRGGLDAGLGRWCASRVEAARGPSVDPSADALAAPAARGWRRRARGWRGGGRVARMGSRRRASLTRVLMRSRHWRSGVAGPGGARVRGWRGRPRRAGRGVGPQAGTRGGTGATSRVQGGATWGSAKMGLGADAAQGGVLQYADRLGSDTKMMRDSIEEQEEEGRRRRRSRWEEEGEAERGREKRRKRDAERKREGKGVAAQRNSFLININHFPLLEVYKSFYNH
ncbi:hypothetical protein Taro_044272 [Colocasia esculenta]|uniref:Uncharacterized protein n=1 Tax=Colocasia esculenta TaxID=4460 RepID=A0A843X321_COLES|nr:hypothetical protein [Colocasia esculenta]